MARLIVEVWRVSQDTTSRSLRQPPPESEVLSVVGVLPNLLPKTTPNLPQKQEMTRHLLAENFVLFRCYSASQHVGAAVPRELFVPAAGQSWAEVGFPTILARNFLETIDASHYM